MNTRRRTATTTATAAAAADGMTITSTQPLRGRKQPKSTAAEQTRRVKKKTARVEKKTAIVKQKTKDTKEEIGSENDRIAKARRKLDALLRKKEQAVKELAEKGMNVSVDKNGIVTDVAMPPLKAAVPLFEALDLPMVGSSITREGKPNQKTLHPTHAAATKMQRLTGTTLTEEDVQKMEYQARYSGFDMKLGGFKHAGKKMTNPWSGQEVDVNCHIYGKENYKAQEEKGTGLAGHNEARSLHLLDTIPETIALYRSICVMLTDEKGGVGFDFRQLPDDYEGDLSQEEVYELLAQSCGCKNLRELQSRVTDPTGALHGMSYVRLNGEEEVKSKKGWCDKVNRPIYKKFGYRFRFKAGNNTRFDVN